MRRLASVLALFLALPAFAATKTWTGGGGTNYWSNGANGSGGVAPVNGDDLVFNGPSTNNDMSGLSLNSIAISGTSPTINGNGISLGAGGISTVVGSVTLSLDIAVTAAQTWTFGGSACSATATVQGNISGGGALTIAAANSNSVTIHLAGHISTTSPLTLGPGSLFFENSNSFSGPLNIASGGNAFSCGFNDHQSGTLTLSASGAIPNGTAVTVGAGGLVGETKLHLGGYSVVLSSLAGIGLVDNGSVTFVNGQSQPFHGQIAATLAMQSGTQTISYSGLSDR